MGLGLALSLIAPAGPALAETEVKHPQTGALTYLADVDDNAAPVAGRMAAVHHLERRRSRLKIGNVNKELRPAGQIRLSDGWRYEFQQVAGDYPVVDAKVVVLLRADGRRLVSITSGYVPKVRPVARSAVLTGQQAIAAAKRVLPKAQTVGEPELAVLPAPNRLSARKADRWISIEHRPDRRSHPGITNSSANTIPPSVLSVRRWMIF